MKTLIFSLVLMAQAMGSPPFYFPTPKDVLPGRMMSQLDAYTGLGAQRDAEQAIFVDNLLARGGTISIETWTWHGKRQFYAMRQNTDGSFNGPNMPMGYYTSHRTYRLLSNH